MQIVQGSLVQVWQKHIRNYTGLSEPELLGTSVPHQSAVAMPAPTSSNGHEIRRDADVLYCVKCGKQTGRPQHLRLKILSRPCTQRSLPESQWLTSPWGICG